MLFVLKCVDSRRNYRQRDDNGEMKDARRDRSWWQRAERDMNTDKSIKSGYDDPGSPDGFQRFHGCYTVATNDLESETDRELHTTFHHGE